MEVKEQQILERELATVDQRRAQLELVISSISPACTDYRNELEAEMNGLWSRRRELAEQLRPRKTPLRAVG